MKNIRTKGCHQVISAPTSQLTVRREDRIFAEVGKKDAHGRWVYFYSHGRKLVWDCNYNYFQFHFEYVDDAPTKTTSEQGFKRWFESKAGRPPTSPETQVKLRDRILELKSEISNAEHLLENAAKYEVAHYWAQQAWEKKHGKG